MLWVALCVVVLLLFVTFIVPVKQLLRLRERHGGCGSCRYRIVDGRGVEYCVAELRQQALPFIRVCFDYSPKLIEDVRTQDG